MRDPILSVLIRMFGGRLEAERESEHLSEKARDDRLEVELALRELEHLKRNLRSGLR